MGRPAIYCQSCAAEIRRAQQRAWQKIRREEARALITAAKSRPCVDCRVAYPTAAMDLDHVRGTKLFNIGLNNQCHDLEALRAEIAKCDVRCSNCHRIRHDEERQAAKRSVTSG